MTKSTLLSRLSRPALASGSALLAVLLSTPVAALAAAQHRTHARKSSAARAGQATTPASAETYACPMHPEVTAKAAGRTCPKCNMKLVKAAAKTGPAKATSPGPAKDAAVVEEAAPIPDTVVYDQDGRRLNFYTDLVRGRTVAVNFIFTTCAGVCPTLTAKFRQLQQQLAARGSGARLISISVDPVTDVPERLKAYAQKFKADEGWTFVTGGKPEIDALLGALGSAAPDKTDHTSTALIINDPAGYRTRASALAPVPTLADLVVEAAAKKPSAPPAAEATDAEAERRRTVEASAKYFPNHTLVTQDGRRVRFYDDLLKGRVVLINFMFTTCAGVCSPMTANLAKVQSYLGERVGRDVWMLSITVDPATDTPEAMRAYAAKHKAGPGWYFLSGEKQNVDWVLYKLGGYTEDKAAHSGVLIIGNEATGQWMKVHAMSKPSEIAAAVVRLAGGEGVSEAR